MLNKWFLYLYIFWVSSVVFGFRPKLQRSGNCLCIDFWILRLCWISSGLWAGLDTTWFTQCWGFFLMKKEAVSLWFWFSWTVLHRQRVSLYPFWRHLNPGEVYSMDDSKAGFSFFLWTKQDYMRLLSTCSGFWYMPDSVLRDFLSILRLFSEQDFLLWWCCLLPVEFIYHLVRVWKLALCHKLGIFTSSLETYRLRHHIQ